MFSLVQDFSDLPILQSRVIQKRWLAASHIQKRWLAASRIADQKETTMSALDSLDFGNLGSSLRFERSIASLTKSKHNATDLNIRTQITICYYVKRIIAACPYCSLQACTLGEGEIEWVFWARCIQHCLGVCKVWCWEVLRDMICKPPYRSDVANPKAILVQVRIFQRTATGKGCREYDRPPVKVYSKRFWLYFLKNTLKIFKVFRSPQFTEVPENRQHVLCGNISASHFCGFWFWSCPILLPRRGKASLLHGVTPFGVLNNVISWASFLSVLLFIVTFIVFSSFLFIVFFVSKASQIYPGPFPFRVWPQDSRPSFVL